MHEGGDTANPQELTPVSDWGERGQIGLADLNAACGGPSGRGSEMSEYCQHTCSLKYDGYIMKG
nr:hypothetical protein B7L52_05955 [Pectobacterium carotovorum]